MAVMADNVQNGSDVFYEEICRAFDAFRKAQMNVRYYGLRAAEERRKSILLNAGSALVTALAVGVLSVGLESLRPFAALLGLFGVALSAISPYLPFAAREQSLGQLGREYSRVAALLRHFISELRREGQVTEAEIAKSRVLLDLLERLAQSDETDYKTRALAAAQKEIDEAYPKNYVWGM